MSTEKHLKYEETAQRKQLLSIRSSKADNLKEWELIIKWLKKNGEGKAKDGLYKLAKDNHII
jgi:hypothetical protein